MRKLHFRYMDSETFQTSRCPFNNILADAMPEMQKTQKPTKCKFFFVFLFFVCFIVFSDQMINTDVLITVGLLLITKKYIVPTAN